MAQTMEYYVMSFDIPIFKFSIGRDKVFNTVEYGPNSVIRNDLLPLGFTNVDKWLNDRIAPKHRVNIEKLLHQCGIRDILAYIDVSMALTLTDAYWVKPENSKVSFDQVNLYTNKFNKAVASLAFNGTVLQGKQFSATSPEISTDGALAKCWVRNNGKIYLYKRGRSGSSNAGFEPYSEYYASQVLEAMGLTDYVKYNLKVYKGRICSSCELFTSKEVGFVSAYNLGLSPHPAELLKVYENIGCGDAFRSMVIFDSIIINDDRHLGNFGFLVDNKTCKIVKNAHIFDNGQSLLPYVTEDKYADIEGYIAQKGPHIGAEFVDLAKILLDSKERSMVRELLNFRFKKHPKYNLNEKRLDVLNKLVRYQVQRILK